MSLSTGEVVTSTHACLRALEAALVRELGNVTSLTTTEQLDIVAAVEQAVESVRVLWPSLTVRVHWCAVGSLRAPSLEVLSVGPRSSSLGGDDIAEIRAIPLPAPVNQGQPMPLFVTAQGDELARVTKERDEARHLLSALHARVSDGHLHTALRAEHSCTVEAFEKLRAEVAGLTAALAAAQRERDAARKVLFECSLWFSTWRRSLLIEGAKDDVHGAWGELERLHNTCAAMGVGK